MSKLDELKKVGFTSDTEVEVDIRHYDWNIEKFSNTLPRNADKIRAMFRAERSRVPFVNFNTWLLLYKELTPTILVDSDLTTYFEEYKNFYLMMNSNGRMSEEFSEYSLEDYFKDEIREFTSKSNRVSVIDMSRDISIGNLSGVRVGHRSTIILERANNILGGK